MKNNKLRFIDLTLEEIIYLSSFTKTTKHFNIDTHMFHYGEYKESSICINKNDKNEWEIYIAEKGKTHSKVTFKSFFDAGLELIRYCCDTDEEYNELKSYFINEITIVKNCLNKEKSDNIILENNNLLIKKK